MPLRARTLHGTSLEAGESSKAYKRSCKETINRSPTTTLRVSLVEQVPRLGQDLLALHYQRDHLLLLLPPKLPLPHPMHIFRLQTADHSSEVSRKPSDDGASDRQGNAKVEHRSGKSIDFTKCRFRALRSFVVTPMSRMKPRSMRFQVYPSS